MNKKHSALTLVIALSLLAFAFALPSFSFATEDVAEENVAVQDQTEDAVDTDERKEEAVPESDDISADEMTDDEYAGHEEKEWTAEELKSIIKPNVAYYGFLKEWIPEGDPESPFARGCVEIAGDYDQLESLPKGIYESATKMEMLDLLNWNEYGPTFILDRKSDTSVPEGIRMPISSEKLREYGYEYKFTYKGIGDTGTPTRIWVAEIVEATPKTSENSIIATSNKDFKLGTDKTVAVEIQKDFDTFGKDVKVYVDGKLVAPENYTVTKGSIIITFKESFLKTLGEGKHEFKTVFSDNTEAKSEFSIVAPKEKVDTTSKTNAKTTKPASKKNAVPQTSDVYSAVTVLMTAVSGAAALKASRKF